MTKLGIKHFLRRFALKEEGVITVESMLILPLLIWSMLASYTFYDGYRQSSRSIKGAYAVADVLSREQDAVNASYNDSMLELYETIVSTRSPASMRVTFLTYKADTDSHDVFWSCVRGADYAWWTQGNISGMKDHLPGMPDNGNMIVVETTNEYRAPFTNIGFRLSNFPMSNFVFTHPRVLDQIVTTDPSCYTNPAY
ncbi:TadE/TadG family type IV pilus assembly protein [Ruegeria sp.]|uniref:TadE/TadG family type IV pilus assembly protein n=1 Tax=Ruegeria sp. TaxID=1879320 RepID=UPI003C7A6449